MMRAVDIAAAVVAIAIVWYLLSYPDYSGNF